MGAACCEVPPGSDEKLATLTLSDIERIEAETGLPRSRFVEEERLGPMEVLAYEAARPIYRGLFVDGLRFGLRTVHGACIFLDRGKGCRLTIEAKPLACRLYPFDFDPVGTLRLVEASRCLALEEARSWSDLFRAFGVSRRSLTRLRKQMEREGREHLAKMRE